jgi:hypothetical protein
VYIGIYAEEFGVSPNEASNLISYANLAFGFGESLGDWTAIAIGKGGRRADGG